MVIQIYISIEDDSKTDVWDYVRGEGTEWEVLPGCLMCQRIFNNINTLYRFMVECENVAGQNLRFDMRTLPKENEDEPDMLSVEIKTDK